MGGSKQDLASVLKTVGWALRQVRKTTPLGDMPESKTGRQAWQPKSTAELQDALHRLQVVEGELQRRTDFWTRNFHEEGLRHASALRESALASEIKLARAAQQVATLQGQLDLMEEERAAAAAEARQLLELSLIHI